MSTIIKKSFIALFLIITTATAIHAQEDSLDKVELKRLAEQRNKYLGK